MPNLNDVAHQFRLVVERAPRNSARIVGIVLEREKGKILHASVLLQVIEKARSPRDSTAGIRPNFNVLVDSLKGRPAQFERRVELMDRARPLHVERGVILGE